MGGHDNNDSSSDPIITVDFHRNRFFVACIASIDLSNDSGIVSFDMTISDDDGATWSPWRSILQYFSSATTPFALSIDKGWMTSDNDRGMQPAPPQGGDSAALYLVYSLYNSSESLGLAVNLLMITSTDGGQTWTDPVFLTAVKPTLEGQGYWGLGLAADAVTSDIYLACTNFSWLLKGKDLLIGTHVWAHTSATEALGPSPVSVAYRRLKPESRWSQPPIIEADEAPYFFNLSSITPDPHLQSLSDSLVVTSVAGYKGNIFVCFWYVDHPANVKANVSFVFSHDGGSSWSSRVILPFQSGYPSAAFDSQGVLHLLVSQYDVSLNRSANLTSKGTALTSDVDHIVYMRSQDFGETFSTPITVATFTLNGDANRCGDYSQLLVDPDDLLHFFWCGVDQTGQSRIFHSTNRKSNRA